jgi:hypothetical protein
LTELYTEPTYDELKEALQNYLNPSDDDSTTTSNGTAQSTTTTEKVATETATKSTENVSDAFDELFNS